jgi:hypothetical protein
MAAVVHPGWYTARPSFERALAEFRTARQRTLALTAHLSQAQLDYAAGPDAWSVGEVLDHLLRSEEIHRHNMEKLVRLAREEKAPVLPLGNADLDISFAFFSGSLEDGPEAPLTLPSEFMVQPACEFIISHRLLPFRTASLARPQWGLPAGELRARLLTAFDSTAAIFHGNPDVDFRELICQHDTAGPLNMLELLHFMARHEAGHQTQIREIVRSQK